ncbi:MAG: hypothetical protein COA99_13110 [Moraxellaceae bacterium]|nr:MAG: hypothetical protein COA99_13110 [Moraxellaceae bacterium]
MNSVASIFKFGYQCVFSVVLFLTILTGCGGSSSDSADPSTTDEITDDPSITDEIAITNDGGSFTLSSKAIKNTLGVPLSSTCDAAGDSSLFQFSWSNVPEGTESYALIFYTIINPDDGVDFSNDLSYKSYYVVYDIDGDISELAAGATGGGTVATNGKGLNAYDPPCSAGSAENTYVVALYALSAESGSSLGLSAASDILDLTTAIENSTLESSSLTLTRIRYNPSENDDHVPTSVPSDCITKSAAFDAYSEFVSVSCDSDSITVTSNYSTPYLSQLDDDKLNVGISTWIGRATVPEEVSWDIPLQPTYLSSVSNNIIIHDPIGFTVDGVPILHYAMEATANEVADPSEAYSARDTLTTGQIDQCGGHGANGEAYHYHYAPVCMLDTHDLSQPVAYMFDGIPLYFGTGGGAPIEGDSDVNYGGGRYTDLDYRPAAVRAGTASLDACNAYDVHGDGSEYVYYTTKERPYTIGCFRGEADQINSPQQPPPNWDTDHLVTDGVTFGQDVMLTDYDTMTYGGQELFFIEITPLATNTNITSGKVALMMWRQLTEGESDYSSSDNGSFLHCRALN